MRTARGPRGPRKPKARGVRKECTLEDLYNGKEDQLEFERVIRCKDCNGVGGSDPTAVQKCTDCKGRGMKMMVRQMGPGMITQQMVPCSACNQSGEVIDKAKQCKKCKGKKIQKEQHKLKVTIDKGMPHGEKQVLSGEADHLPDMEPGDIVVLVMQKPHKVFERKGADLVHEKKITLLEALTGFSFVLKHLDGRKIKISSDAGQVIKPNSMMTCVGLGMPFFKKSYEFGNLFIKFQVEFPDTIKAQESLNAISTALAKSEGQTPPAKDSQDLADEEVTMQKLEDRHKNTHAEGGKTHDHHDEEEDDDDEEGGQRVGCQQQ